MKEKKIRYISLFSGIGGFERGIEQTTKKEEYTCIGFSEIDKYAKNIYKKHYPNHISLGDATAIRTEDLPDFDLLVGGFPCQAFSHAGKRRGFDDARGTLFFEISRILRDKRPRYFLLENVRGLLSHERGKTFQTMLRTLGELGYDVQWQIYNSKDFNVPQNRERIYIKGYSREECGGEILSQRQNGTKTHTTTRKQHKLGGYNFAEINDNTIVPCTKEGNFFALITRQRDTPLQKHQDNYVFERKPLQIGNVCRGIGGKVYSTDGVSPTLLANGGGLGAKTGLYKVDKPTEPQLQKVGNIRKNGKNQSGNVFHTDGLSPALCSSDYKNATKIVEYPRIDEETIMLKNNTKKGYLPAREGDGVVLDFADARGRVQPQTSPTMTAHGNVGTVTRDLAVRRLTPLECERLQGFPDNWTKYGANGDRISDTQRYKCIGNAVTTNVVQHIIEEWEMTV